MDKFLRGIGDYIELFFGLLFFPLQQIGELLRQSEFGFALFTLCITTPMCWVLAYAAFWFSPVFLAYHLFDCIFGDRDSPNVAANLNRSLNEKTATKTTASSPESLRTARERPKTPPPKTVQGVIDGAPPKNESSDDVYGVYYITNTKNSKVYVGESIHVATRWRQHRSSLANKIHHNYRLQNDYSAQDGADFVFTLEDKVEPIQKLNFIQLKIILWAKEIWHIRELKKKGLDLYNLTDGGGSKSDLIDLMAQATAHGLSSEDSRKVISAAIKEAFSLSQVNKKNIVGTPAITLPLSTPKSLPIEAANRAQQGHQAADTEAALATEAAIEKQDTQARAATKKKNQNEFWIGACGVIFLLWTLSHDKAPPVKEAPAPLPQPSQAPSTPSNPFVISEKEKRQQEEKDRHARLIQDQRRIKNQQEMALEDRNQLADAIKSVTVKTSELPSKSLDWLAHCTKREIALTSVARLIDWETPANTSAFSKMRDAYGRECDSMVFNSKDASSTFYNLTNDAPAIENSARDDYINRMTSSSPQQNAPSRPGGMTDGSRYLTPQNRTTRKPENTGPKKIQPEDLEGYPHGKSATTLAPQTPSNGLSRYDCPSGYAYFIGQCIRQSYPP